jgi:hypothetical protein
MRLESLTRQTGILTKTLLIVLVCLGLKILIHRLDWEWVSNLGMLNALLGGVVFTLAILLAATLADFKESERIVGELASQLRSLHWDMAFIVPPAVLPQAMGNLRSLTGAILENLRRGKDWKSEPLYKELDALNRYAHDAGRAGASTAQVRTVQVWLGNIIRIVDRTGVIMQTNFVRAGYALAGVAVFALIIAFVGARLEPFYESLYLFGFGCFLLVGLFLLIWDLDNPFHGDARISPQQLEALEEFLAGLSARP